MHRSRENQKAYRDYQSQSREAYFHTSSGAVGVIVQMMKSQLPLTSSRSYCILIV